MSTPIAPKPIGAPEPTSKPTAHIEGADPAGGGGRTPPETDGAGGDALEEAVGVFDSALAEVCASTRQRFGPGPPYSSGSCTQ